MPTVSPTTLPDPYPVKPNGLHRSQGHSIRVPGSKSITNRALVLAAMAERPFKLTGVLDSDDTRVMMTCLKDLGFQVAHDPGKEETTVSRPAGSSRIPASAAELFVGNSGTTVRFLGAMLGLGKGTYRLDGVPRMRERPIQDLLDGLNQLGIDATSDAATGCPPIAIRSQGWSGGRIRVKADVSSQYLSGLMLAAPFGDGETVIEVVGEAVSEPYIAMTVAMLRDFGLVVEVKGATYRIPGPQTIKLDEYAIEPDASSASYFFAAAAITNNLVVVPRLNLNSLQGDVHFAQVLQTMGCELRENADGLTMIGTGTLRGIEIDMNAISDTVMTLAVVACFADGPTTIANVAHIRHKETDRLSALATELRKFGIRIDERQDGLTIHPGPMHGATVDTYDDHRMAMSLALIGLRVPGVFINNPGCVAKTYPNFWADFAAFQ